MTRATYLLRLDPADKQRWEAEASRVDQSLNVFIYQRVEHSLGRYHPRTAWRRRSTSATPADTARGSDARTT